ncbi:uncharacterized protein BcabD6B2_12020 [Babesia caballi]|uniref:Uncharacterized protein n=1 Tax=Babesia caballi TaxID=5871 RepID=A0AAV4LQ73_BABCB|nr:hypothetical protein, conserved [Babesia caballi]
MGCTIDIPTPTSLKEALLLLHAMSNSVNGSQKGVKDEIRRRIQKRQSSVGDVDNHIGVNNNFQSVLENASDVHRRIVFVNRVNNYGSYKPLLDTHSDAACASRILDILEEVLPKLIETLKFLFEKVEQIDNAHWGGQQCNGGSFHGYYHASRYGGVELQNWLLDKSHYGNYFRRGYKHHELSSNPGDAFKEFLKTLVKPGQNSLEKLYASIKSIAKYGLRSQANPSPNPPSHDVSSRGLNRGSGRHGYNGFNSQHIGQTLSPHLPSTFTPTPPAPSSGYQAERQIPGNGTYAGSGRTSTHSSHQTAQSPRTPPPNYSPPSNPGINMEDHGSHQDYGTGSAQFHEVIPEPQTTLGSTAAIGGAVGATGLVGGGAAVYFLNIGGIRTLIAG